MLTAKDRKAIAEIAAAVVRSMSATVQKPVQVQAPKAPKAPKAKSQKFLAFVAAHPNNYTRALQGDGAAFLSLTETGRARVMWGMEQGITTSRELFQALGQKTNRKVARKFNRAK